MVNGTTRGRDEERERRTEDMRDRKIDIGTRSAHTSERERDGRREGVAAAVRGGSARRRRRGKRNARARTEYIDR